jgi:alpha-tubulin suppressor-like RCC1 family protein
MFAWGKSESYQLTINSINIIPYPVLTPCSFKHLTSVHSKSDYNSALCNHKVYTWGANLFSRLGNVESKVRIPQQVALPKKIIKISLGNHHVVAVSVDG